MKIKYVGLKDFEDAFHTETGVTWGPDVSHDIKPDIAARMLRHPDVFAMAEADEPGDKKPAGDEKPEGDKVPEAPPAPKFAMQTADGVLALDELDKETLHKLAKEAGIEVHANAAAKTVAAKLAEAFPVNPE